MNDLVLKGGRVVDPSQGLDKVTDIAFANGKVAAIGDNLTGKDSRNVAGKIVSPGLIDLHTHVYWGGTSLGVEAELLARTGEGSITCRRKPWKLPGPALPASMKVVTPPVRASSSASTPSEVPPQ